MGETNAINKITKHGIHRDGYFADYRAKNFLTTRKTNGEKNKYQILCANCNFIKRYTDNEVTGPPKKYE